jgi:hypothetical protein
MKNRSSIRNIRNLCACALFVSACGGRAVTIEGSAGSAATGDVGTGGASTGGTGGGGRANGGTGNVGRAGSGSAGLSSAGAGNACGFTTCPLLACGPRSTPYYPPGACCPICQSNCDAPCPNIACASGYELQQQPDQCCPSCVPSTMLDCATGQQNYQQLRSQLVSKYQYGCASDADCVAAAVYNNCESGCSLVPIWSGAANNLNSNLSSAALMDCAACGSAPPPCLIPPAPVACYQGQCAFQSNLPK